MEMCRKAQGGQLSYTETWSQISGFLGEASQADGERKQANQSGRGGEGHPLWSALVATLSRSSERDWARRLMYAGSSTVSGWNVQCFSSSRSCGRGRPRPTSPRMLPPDRSAALTVFRAGPCQPRGLKYQHGDFGQLPPGLEAATAPQPCDAGVGPAFFSAACRWLSRLSSCAFRKRA